MKILVTGGAGYIGYSFVRSLLASSAPVREVVVYDNLSRKNYNLFLAPPFPGNEKLRFVSGELLDNRKLEQTLQNVDVVFHLAARVTTPYADQDAHSFEQINHWGTAALVDAVERAGTGTFVFLSSTSVYGSSEVSLDEQAPLSPQSFYGTSKMRAEQQVERLKAMANTFIIRAGNVYGHNPVARFDAVINRFMFEAHFNNRITVQGDGEQMRAFIHVDKIAQVLTGLLESPVPAGTYNAVEHNFAVNDAVNAIRKIYPEVEVMHINRQVKMNAISIDTPCKIFEFLPMPKKDFEQELKDFKRAFAF